MTERRATGEPVSIGDALARCRQSSVCPKPTRYARSTDAWETVVGVDVAAHARLVAVRDDTISIVVDGTLWATQLRYLEADIVERANALVGSRVAEQIRVRVEPRS